MKRLFKLNFKIVSTSLEDARTYMERFAENFNQNVIVSGVKLVDRIAYVKVTKDLKADNNCEFWGIIGFTADTDNIIPIKKEVCDGESS